MQRCHPARGGGVRVRAGIDEREDDSPLTSRIPTRRPGHANDCGVKRFCTSTVSCADVRTPRDEFACDVTVVAERGGMQRSVAFVDLCKALGQEELITSGQRSRRQRWSRVEKVSSSLVVTCGDGFQETG